MNQFIKTTILFFLTAVMAVTAQEETKVWSLKECIEYAVQNNLQVKQQQIGLQEADINISNAYGNYLPNLTANANNTWNTGLSRNPITNTNERLTVRNSSYSLGSNIVVFSGLQNYHQLQAAKLQKVANQYNLETIKDNISLQLANSYLQIVIQKENLEVLKAQHQITLGQLKQTKQLVAAGNLPQGDVLTLQATSATDLQNIANAENNVLIAKTAMKQLLNLEFDTPFQVASTDPSFDDLAILETPINTILENVLGIRNEVKLAEKNLEISEEQIEIAKGRQYPSIGAFANAGSSESGGIRDPFFTQIDENFGFNYGLSLNFPVLNGFQIKNGIKQSKINKQRNELQLAQVKQNLSRDVYQAHLDAKASNKAYEAAKLAVNANELAFEYAEKRYEVGISNSLDFAQSKILYQNSQVQLIQAKYDLLFRLKLLELYTEGKIN